jgi:DNA-binding NtrC family response regulator
MTTLSRPLKGPRLLPPAPGLPEPVLLGRSAAIQRLRREVELVAKSGAAIVLVSGETGTGKDLVARALHAAGPRNRRPFVPVNCSAVPAALFEDAFFGHESGAYTDARERRAGLVESASGGTLFLDEVGELEPGVQAKFLRVLEESTIRRLGSTADVPIDVAFIAATNRDLAAATRSGAFRRDLYYRLNVVGLAIPPLRERLEDVPLLAEHFLDEFAARFKKPFAGFAPDALARLAAHPWPGNVRELRNAVERVVLLNEGPLVTREALLLDDDAGRGALSAVAGAEDFGLASAELRALVRALQAAGGNQSGAARLLGVSRDTVRALVKRHGVRTEVRVVVDRPRSG